MARLFKEIVGRELALPLARLKYRDSFDRYGTDAPDLRFALEIQDISDIAGASDFNVFRKAVRSTGIADKEPAVEELKSYL